MRHRFLQHKLITILVLLAVIAVVFLAVRATPATESDIRSAACLVRGTDFLCLVSGKDTVTLRADSVNKEGVWINRHWWWPSCDGRVLTVNVPEAASFLPIDNADSLRHLVAVRTDSLAALLHRKDIENKELQYYMRSHGVIDEGYTQIATYAAAQARETAELAKIHARLRAMLQHDSVAHKPMHLIRRSVYTVTWYDGDTVKSVACKPLITKLSRHGASMIVHTRRLIKPWGVYAVRNVPWGATAHKKVIVVKVISEGRKSGSPEVQSNASGKKGQKGEGQSTAKTGTTILTKGNYWQGHSHDIPHLFAPDGAPVFTIHGRFLGVVYGRAVI
jgi:hypothetical protein